MTQTEFGVDKRSTKKPKQLRRDGMLPANVFGGKESQAIEMPTKKFKNLYAEVGDTGVISLKVGGDNTVAAMVDEVQIDALSGDILHVAFREVSLKNKLTAEVPVELVGEFKIAEGVLVTVRDQVEVEALPMDIPEKFEINLEELTEVGQTITYQDLKFDKTKVTLVIGEEGEDAPIVIVQEQKEEVVEEVEEVVEGEEGETAEAGVEGEGKTAEATSTGEKSEGKEEKKD